MTKTVRQMDLTHTSETSKFEGLLHSRLFAVLLCLLVGAGAGLVTAGLHPLAGFGLVFGILIALALLSNAQYGLFAIVAVVYLLPFGVVPLPVGGLKLTFLDASLSAVLLVWLLRLLLKPDVGLVTTRLDLGILVFIGLAVFSFVLGINSVTGEVFRFFLKTINSILFYFTITNCVRGKGELLGLTKAIVLGGFGAALIAIVLYFLPAALANELLLGLRTLGYYPSGQDILRNIAGTTTLRATGTAVDPNVLGGMLLLSLPLVASLFFGKLTPGGLSRPLLGVAALACLLALILTFSRSSWLGTGVALFFLATVKYRRLWIVFVLVAVVLLLLPQGELLFGRMEAGVTFSDRASQMRLGEYRDALRVIEQYPWFGAGFGSSPDVDLYLVSASIYLLIAQEMGLVGLSAFLVIAVLLLSYALRNLFRVTDLQIQPIQAGALASLVGALTAGAFDHYFFNLHFPHTIALFWLFVALVMVSTKLGVQNKS